MTGKIVEQLTDEQMKPQLAASGFDGELELCGKVTGVEVASGFNCVVIVIAVAPGEAERYKLILEQVGDQT